jgi:spore germination protein YaaH
MQRLSLSLLLALICLLPPGSSAAAAASQRTVLGYYVPYDPTSWSSLQNHADALDFVAAQWVSVDACGGLTTHDDQTLKQFGAQHTLKIMPSLLTGGAALSHSLLTDPDVAARLTQNIVEYTLQEKYPGFDLDIEAVAADDRDALTAFVSQTAAALHRQGRLLALAVPAKERDVTVGWSGAYDYAALGAAADLITIMAYEAHGPFSGPGSVSPYPWVDRVLAFVTQQIDPDKVLLGLAAYGYDWNTTAGGARAIGYVQAAALATRYAAPIEFDPISQTGTFGYDNLAGDALPVVVASPAVDHAITVRTPPACDAQAPAPAQPTPRPTPEDGSPQSHEVWIEDSVSLLARTRLADSYGLRGIATWRLGLEDPRVWDNLPSRPPQAATSTRQAVAMAGLRCSLCPRLPKAGAAR